MEDNRLVAKLLKKNNSVSFRSEELTHFYRKTEFMIFAERTSTDLSKTEIKSPEKASTRSNSEGKNWQI